MNSAKIDFVKSERIICPSDKLEDMRVEYEVNFNSTALNSTDSQQMIAEINSNHIGKARLAVAMARLLVISEKPPLEERVVRSGDADRADQNIHGKLDKAVKALDRLETALATLAMEDEEQQL